MSVALQSGEGAEINRVRERFAAGSQDLDGIRPSIALSWTRCRDRYGVDPRLALAPPALDPSHRCLDRDVLLTGLGGHAAALRQLLGTGVVTVVDEGGQLVGSWGEGIPAAGEAHLRPWYSWSEMSSGTNGMGTALEAQTLSSVRGPEHWCEGFHALDCLGAPVIDPVTSSPLAAVNVSTLTGGMPDDAPDLLRRTTALVRATLISRAEEHATALATAFTSAMRGRRGGVLAVDTGGNVVVASLEAGQLLGIEARQVRTDPADRVRLDDSEFGLLAAKAAHAAHDLPGWIGSVEAVSAGAAEGVQATLVAVHQGCHPIGFLMTLGDMQGEPITPDPPEVLPQSQLSRVVAQVRGRTLVLLPAEIRYAEADGNTVWLATDRGRARAAHRGLKNLEHALAGHGFLRVHRRYLVNLARVVEVERGPGGELKLILDAGRSSAVPVARAHAGAVRRHLGL
ncbi:DNA-binding protein [Nocardioides sp. CF8]|uniref:DNA-binding protein n=1 Tax=Nocardioides sp. CF8 TaxID=110319 RepID=UPI0006864EDE|nr:DNA-binding protein [Nocardioides sp. CF8]